MIGMIRIVLFPGTTLIPLLRRKVNVRALAIEEYM